MCYGGNCAHESHYAKGGETGYEKGINKGRNLDKGVSYAGVKQRGQLSIDPQSKSESEGESKEQHKKTLSEMKSMPKPNLYADGGDVADEDEMHPMVSKVMMSRGGMIANEDEPEADSMPAEFDDLALDDHLEGTNSGAADGDEIGDEQETDDRHNIVAKILSSRKKKDRMPRPA
jgi:hypothetical protein